MTGSLLPLALVVALGSAFTMRLVTDHNGRTEPAAVSHSAMNRDIERRLDLVVNGPSQGCGPARKSIGRLPPSDAFTNIPHPQPCASPENWKERP
jgi:hypothetical protein